MLIFAFFSVINDLTVSQGHEINTKLEIITLCASFPLRIDKGSWRLARHLGTSILNFGSCNNILYIL